MIGLNWQEMFLLLKQKDDFLNVELHIRQNCRPPFKFNNLQLVAMLIWIQDLNLLTLLHESINSS